MTIRFDLPESLEELDQQEELLEQPCFPYPGYEQRPGGINFWATATTKRLIRLNLKGIGPQQASPGKFRLNGRKALLQVAR